ncbi:MAG: ribosome maturation factor RimM [Bacillota bacterium]
MNSERIAIGKIVTTHGIRGEVKVLPLTDFIDRFFDTKTVLVEHPSGRSQTMALETVRIHKNMAIIKFAEIPDTNVALTWVHALLTVSKDELVPLPEGQYYIFDIIGMEVWTEDGELLGTVTDVLKPGANDVYVVRLTPEVRQRSSEKSGDLLLPVIDDVIKETDLSAKKIIVHLLDGLL